MGNYTHHRDYKICEHCGSTLDHGERCDCQDTKCEICGGTLKWGRFAHNQTMCAECNIADKTTHITKEKFKYETPSLTDDC